jgi:hypothetical protein
VEVVNDEGEKVMTDVAHKQLRYLPLTPRVKQMFLSKKIAMHMRWHKEGVCDPDIAADPRNVIGLTALMGLDKVNMA